jgi:ABC-type branched-subunit amino acid transport system substrate-binding protein
LRTVQALVLVVTLFLGGADMLRAERRSHRVDVLIPRSGEFAELGEEFLRGFLLSIKGDFEVRVWETEADPRRARGIVGKTLEKGSSLLVGPLSSAAVNEVIPLVEAHQIPMISPVASDLDAGAESEYVFPFTRILREEAFSLLDLVIDSVGADTVLLFYPSTAIGLSLSSLFERELVARGALILHSLPFSPDSFDFRSHVDLVLGADSTIACHGAFIPLGGRAGAALASQLGQIDPQMPVYGLEHWGRKEITDLLFGLEKNVVFGMIAEGVEEEIHRAELTSSFESEFRAKYGRNPSIIARKGYDAGLLTNYVFEKGPVLRSEARDRLVALGVLRGISGDILLSREKGFITFHTYDGGRIRAIRKRDYERFIRRQEISEKETP